MTDLHIRNLIKSAAENLFLYWLVSNYVPCLSPFDVSFSLQVTRPHPSDHPLLFLFLVGGVTPSELRLIREVVSTHKSGTQVGCHTLFLTNAFSITLSFKKKIGCIKCSKSESKGISNVTNHFYVN